MTIIANQAEDTRKKLSTAENLYPYPVYRLLNSFNFSSITPSTALTASFIYL